MVFNTPTFLCFFILFFCIYWTFIQRLSIHFRNACIIAASYIFYGWWDWRFLGLIVISSITDFSIGILLGGERGLFKRRALLTLSVLVNIGILGFFKYFNFFIDSLRGILALFYVDVNVSTLQIILPVGISFYTFQTLSYTIDVYNRKLEPTHDILAFFAFVSFFPQLVAGPIERATQLLKQFEAKRSFNYDTCIAGLRLVLWGYFKKIVIADNFGLLADGLFDVDMSSGTSVILGALFFAIQIYADFSGYSDIAIGISRMLGFQIMTNFRTPYFAQTFQSFWHRWHISLSTWFKDYVYIPLGGNQRSRLRVSCNILVTFILSGLWHGAGVNFIVWGGLHGLALIAEKRIDSKSRPVAYPLFVMIAVVLLWIPFRAENLDHLLDMVNSLSYLPAYSFHEIAQVLVDFSISRFIVLSMVAMIFFLIEFQMRLQDFHDWLSQRSKHQRVLIYYGLILVILFIGNFTVKPDFIYFQF